MDNNSCIENVRHPESRVKMLQAAWPTGDVERSGTINWNESNKMNIRQIAQSRLFLVAAILFSIVALPSVILGGVSPFTLMAIGIWIIYAQARKDNGEIGGVGFTFLVIGQYYNFIVGILGALMSFCVIVEGCTDLGQQHTDLQDVMFWGSGLLLIITFLIAGYRWKLVCAVKEIREASNGNANDGSALMGAIIECFVIGVFSCLSVVGIVYGVMAILFGCVLLRYAKNMSKIEQEMLEQEIEKDEQPVIVPTWKRIEENR